MWAIGNWLNYGERRYGKTYSQTVETTGYDCGTLRDAKWHSGVYEMSARTGIRCQPIRFGRISDHKITRIDELIPWRYAQHGGAQPDPICFGRWGAAGGHRFCADGLVLCAATKRIARSGSDGP